MILRVVECPEPVTVRATGPIRHLCPFVYEVDEGQVTIEWTTGAHTIELHSLTAYLESFADQTLSHEEVADTIRTYVSCALPGQAVAVSLVFNTAGLACEVSTG